MEHTMNTDIKNFINNLSESTLLTIFEGFLKAVSDADTYDEIVEHLDITDDEMFEIRETVQNFMGDKI
jgi:hypothetical protein